MSNRKKITIFQNIMTEKYVKICEGVKGQELNLFELQNVGYD